MVRFLVVVRWEVERVEEPEQVIERVGELRLLNCIVLEPLTTISIPLPNLRFFP
jgi:hypothetical protein